MDPIVPYIFTGLGGGVCSVFTIISCREIIRYVSEERAIRTIRHVAPILTPPNSINIEMSPPIYILIHDPIGLQIGVAK